MADRKAGVGGVGMVGGAATEGRSDAGAVVGVVADALWSGRVGVTGTGTGGDVVVVVVGTVTGGVTEGAADWPTADSGR